MQTRTYAIMLRLTDEERTKLTAARHEANLDWLPLATWLRRLIFDSASVAAAGSNGVAHRKPARAAAARARKPGLRKAAKRGRK